MLKTSLLLHIAVETTLMLSFQDFLLKLKRNKNWKPEIFNNTKVTSDQFIASFLNKYMNFFKPQTLEW